MQGTRIEGSVFAVVGKSFVLRRDRTDRLVEAFGGPDGALVTRVDGAECDDIAEILDQLRTPMLFSTGKTIVQVDRADELVATAKGGGGRTNRAVLEKYLQEPEDAILILCFESLPSNQRIYKLIEKVGSVEKVDFPTDRRGNVLVKAALQWTTERAAQTYGRKLAANAAQSLVEHVGADPDILDMELAKLASYSEGRATITAEDVDALCGLWAERNIFGVAEAALQANAAGALESWARVVATDPSAGVAHDKVLGGLAWRVRQELARNPGRDTRSIELMQRELLALDSAIKSGRATSEVALQCLLVKLAHAARRAGR